MANQNNTAPLVLPYYQYVRLDGGAALFNAKIYVGVANTDPTNVANQIDVLSIQAGGGTTVLDQPIRTNAAGLAVDDVGNVVYPVISVEYSITVTDQNDALIYEESCVTPGSISLTGELLLDPKDFGATSTVDSTLEIQATYDAANLTGASVYRSETYRSDESIQVYSVPTVGPGTFDFSNATTLSLSNACLFSGGTLTDLGVPSVDIVKGEAKVTLLSAPSLINSDIIFIGSTEQFNDAREAYKKGEAPIVQSVTGNQIDIYGSFFDDYTAADAKVFKMNSVSPTFDGGSIIAPNFSGATCIRVFNGRDVLINNVKCTGAGTNGIVLEQCVDSQVTNCTIIERRNNVDVAEGLDYGLLLSNCQRFAASGNTLIGERHGFTTGGGLNDFPNSQVSIVNREINVDNNFISNDLQLSLHVTGGSAIQSCDLHGNSDYVNFTNNIIMNGLIVSGNHINYSDNFVYGSNDNGNNLVRGSELQGADLRIENNTFISLKAVQAHDSADRIFINMSLQHSNDVGINSRKALKHGGTIIVRGNTFTCLDETLTTNHLPIEFLLRRDVAFAGGDINLDFSDNAINMPLNGNTYGSSVRLTTSQGFTTTPEPWTSVKSKGNTFNNCGGIRTSLIAPDVQYSTKKFSSFNDEINANGQAPNAHFIENVVDDAEFIGLKVNGVTKTPFVLTCQDLTVQTVATLTKNVVVRGHIITDSIKTGASTTERTMGIINGANNIVVENNFNATSVGTNIEDLYFIHTYDTAMVRRSGNTDSSGITTYALTYDATTDDKFGDLYEAWDDTARTSFFIQLINEHNTIDTSGGAFDINTPVNPPDNSEFEILDVGGALSVNNAPLKYDGTHTIMGLSADLNLDRDFINYKFRLFNGTDWRIV